MWNVVSWVMIVQEAGMLQPYVFMHHAAAIFSLLRSGVTCTAGIAESLAAQLIWSAQKIPFLENTLMCKGRGEYKYTAGGSTVSMDEKKFCVQN